MNLQTMEPAAVKRETLSAQIAAKLRQDIFTGVYIQGDRLPPEREIAEQFGISRVTVRQALQELAREDWIEIVQGRGATVLDFRRTVGLDALPPLLVACPGDVVTPEAFMAMHDFANWLYMQICVSAARRANHGHEQKLLDIIHEYKQGITAGDYARIEGNFFYELLSIGENLVLFMFFNTYMKTFQLLVASGTLPAPPIPRDLFLKMNKELIAAVCANEPGQISGLLEKHRPEVEKVLDQYLSLLGLNVLTQRQP